MDFHKDTGFLTRHVSFTKKYDLFEENCSGKDVFASRLEFVLQIFLKGDLSY